ncbi:MAG: histidine--tRNA ligase [Proteobacteria bacterium]|nr:histidine--tRNA ligase [Pseudomonadota bacterium]
MPVHLPRGTRDFLPSQMNNRLLVMEKVRRVFRRFGFEPLQTPAFERIETLTGKYGGDGEKLIYKILKRGQNAEPGECDHALRYDLTVPLARVVAMHPELRLPFKRYQIQPVWRADRPQKGRYREFWQCDVDTVGTAALTADAECIAVVAAALRELGLEGFTIRINDRRILSAVAQFVGAKEREAELLITIDKLDKIGRNKVTAELQRRGFSAESVEKLWTVLSSTTLDDLQQHLGDEAREGVDALRQLFNHLEAHGEAGPHIRLDPTLARGLDYYTGPVFEAIVEKPAIGSIAGGGRYDGLIGMFSSRTVPAVGVSLGIERILVAMESLKLLPECHTTTEVLVTVFNSDTLAASIAITQKLRQFGVDSELFLGTSKLKAQFKYANARAIPWVIVAGPDEVASETIRLKNLQSGEQHACTLEEALVAISPPGS